MEPASVIADIPDAGGDRHWKEILAGFVDDPDGCLRAATELLEEEMSAFVALLGQRRESMLNATSSQDDAKTEQMRRSVLTYRDLSRQLAASTEATGR